MREIGLNSENNEDKWGYMAKEQSRVSQYKITKRRHQGLGIFLKCDLSGSLLKMGYGLIYIYQRWGTRNLTRCQRGSDITGA